MKNNFNKQRRSFLKGSLALGSLIMTDWLAPSFVYSNCELTPRESSGAFFALNYPLAQETI